MIFMQTLVIVDMLKDFISESGAVRLKSTEKLIENVSALREEAYRTEIPVIYVCDSLDENDLRFRTWPRHAVKNTEGAEIIEELTPRESSDTVFEKQRFSAFSNPEFEKFLKENACGEIVVTGVTTDYSVKHSVLDALASGYRVTVAADAIQGAGFKHGDINKALLQMGKAGAEGKLTAELISKD